MAKNRPAPTHPQATSQPSKVQPSPVIDKLRDFSVSAVASQPTKVTEAFAQRRGAETLSPALVLLNVSA